MNKNLKAFSLIELSIVILIIGILIVGVTQSSRLIREFRLSTAKNLTQSSPVSTMGNNLVFWYETTSGETSVNYSEDEASLPISNLYDINPNSIYKANASASGTERPSYKAECINGLPCVEFDGVDDCMDLTAAASSTNVSYFVVMKPITISTTQGAVILVHRTGWVAGTGAVALQMLSNAEMGGAQDKLGHYSVDETSGRTTALLSKASPQIVSAVDTGSLFGFFRNGVADGTYATSGAIKRYGNMSLGCAAANLPKSRFYNGHLAEIIVYNRGLKTSERKSVEAYLGKKWGIKVI